MWRELLMKCVYLYVYLYETGKFLAALFLYPFHDLIINFLFRFILKKYGIVRVYSTPTAKNQVYIKDVHKLTLKVARNILYGILDSFKEGILIADIPYCTKCFRGLTAFDGFLLKDTQYYIAGLFNVQKGNLGWEVAKHYDTGNDWFQIVLDPNMQYTCGYWKNAKNLQEAQIAKMDLLAQKMKLKPGMKVLDIGCGWGGLARYLAKNYGVSVTGCTISEKQTEFAREFCKGFDVEFMLQDYRDIAGDKRYDRIVSVGAMEHFGRFNYETFFKVCCNSLKDDGILVLHTMGMTNPRIPTIVKWANDFIFPNSEIPRLEDLLTSARSFFALEDLQNFGADYELTVREWEKNLDAGWPKLKENYGEDIYPLWKTYLQAAQGLLGARFIHLFHFVFTKQGLMGGYQAPR